MRQSLYLKILKLRISRAAIMAKHAEKEANPLYPVPMLMTRKELEEFYYRIADWSNEK